MAERAGFEPARRLLPYTISSRARSAAPAPLQLDGIVPPTGPGYAYSRETWDLSHYRQPSARLSTDWNTIPFLRSSKLTLHSHIIIKNTYGTGLTVGANRAMADAGFIKVAQVSEIRPGEMIAVEVADEQVLLVNVDGNIHALDDICTHAYASMSEGDLRGDEVECPLHGGAFSCITGVPTNPPANTPLRVFSVQIDGDDILVGPPNK